MPANRASMARISRSERGSKEPPGNRCRSCRAENAHKGLGYALSIATLICRRLLSRNVQAYETPHAGGTVSDGPADPQPAGPSDHWLLVTGHWSLTTDY